jgi:dihydropteroate synthase
VQNKLKSNNLTFAAGTGLMDFSRPKVMGIINTTPDSFFGGSRQSGLEDALRAAEKMIGEGADFLDIGGYSSRPGAEEVSEEEELLRVVRVTEAIHKNFPGTPVSVDTFRSTVAKACLDAGAVIINDITAGTHAENMFETVASFNAAMILMHMRGTPATMGSLTVYSDVITEVALYLKERVDAAQRAGINDLMVDPGFGFAKTIDQNFEMLQHLYHFQICGRPVLAGLSRKSMVWKTLETNPEGALNGTTALHMAALLKGASILRVHDVKPASECVNLFVKMENRSLI